MKIATFDSERNEVTTAVSNYDGCRSNLGCRDLRNKLDSLPLRWRGGVHDGRHMRLEDAAVELVCLSLKPKGQPVGVKTAGYRTSFPFF